MTPSEVDHRIDQQLRPQGINLKFKPMTALDFISNNLKLFQQPRG